MPQIFHPVIASDFCDLSFQDAQTLIGSPIQEVFVDRMFSTYYKSFEKRYGIAVYYDETLQDGEWIAISNRGQPYERRFVNPPY